MIKGIESCPALADVQRLGEIERGKYDAALSKVANHSEIHPSRMQSDPALIMTNQSVPRHEAVDRRRIEVAIDAAGCRQAHSASDVDGVHQLAKEAPTCA